MRWDRLSHGVQGALIAVACVVGGFGVVAGILVLNAVTGW